MFSVNTVIHQPGHFAKEQLDDSVEYQWPEGGLQYIPDWVYTSPAIYQREIKRIFHGPTWNFVALEAEVPNPGDFKRSFVGPTNERLKSPGLGISASSATKFHVAPWKMRLISRW